MTEAPAVQEISLEGADNARLANFAGPMEQNLAWRAAAEYATETGWPAGFAIQLEKHIPVGGGLGGGSAPGTTLPTKLVMVEHPSQTANDLEHLLRRQPVPIIARIEHKRVVLDLRTVDPPDDTLLLSAFDGVTA